MIWILIFALILVISILWWIAKAREDNYYSDKMTPSDITIVSGIILLIMIIAIPIGRNETRKEIVEFEAVKLTISQQRADSLSSMERLQLVHTIISQNQWLAREQYKATHWAAVWYDKAILN